ncbi:hypothetical protein HZH66_015415 [Vespula vulgaris]|uniref:WH2 domain-containing protein n=1 Tax=Vespula vulgaris TaxID=7454 RepID=A0A834IWA1_VESVU|nr:hypothetical protein HZH66_015415 [Vespula vulgaris]
MPGAGGQPPQQRTTFRPPWVKDGGPNPLPMPTAPWTLNSRRDSKSKAEEPPAFTKVTLKSVSKPTESVQQSTEPGQQATRKQSKITIIPSQPKSDKNSNAAATAAATATTTKTKTTSSTPPSSKPRENGRQEPNSRPQLERQVRIERSRSRGDTIPLSKSESSTGKINKIKLKVTKRIYKNKNNPHFFPDIPPLTENQEKQLEMLKSRPRKRPDWASMMKEVESGRRLRHVTCNDRSAPLIERVNKVTADPAGKAHFVFESEKSNMHNQLLKQIQEGVKLKSVKTNDRSKPILEGLRKFRRQLTIEEQMQKVEVEDEPDDVIDDDDIDAVRDDLQSTKQMLAIELRNKEALERENKRLQARILNLEAEVERSRSQKNVQEYKQQDEKLTESLREEARTARKDAERLEKEYASTAEERDKYKNELEEMKRMYANLEKRMKAGEGWVDNSDDDDDDDNDDDYDDDNDDDDDDDNDTEPIVELAEDNTEEAWYNFSGMALAGCPSAKDVARIASQKSMDNKQQDMSETEEEEEEEEESTEEEEEDSKASAEKRLQREIKLLSSKVKNFMDKAVNARKERHALKEQIKQQQKLLKEEKRKFKHLQKEVDKMAKLMADTEGDDEEEEEEEEEEETESEESESEESEEEEESDIDEVGHTTEQEKDILQKRVKRHENRLAALKKGNYLLKAQVDRLKDDLAKQREESITLQEDLDSVLAELG